MLEGDLIARIHTQDLRLGLLPGIDTDRLLAAGLFLDTWFGSQSWEAAFHTRCFPACLLAVVQRGTVHKGDTDGVCRCVGR